MVALILLTILLEISVQFISSKYVRFALEKKLVEPSERWRFSDTRIDDLNNFVSPYIQSRCLITLTNFKQINLPLHSPVIKQSLIELVKRYDRGHERPFRIFGPEDLTTRNLTISSGVFNTCPLSKYLTNKTDMTSLGFQKHEVFCHKLNLQTFWKSTKSWNCIVKLVLFPPKFYFEFYIEIKWNENYLGRISEFPYVFPNPDINSIQIFMLEEPFSNRLIKPMYPETYPYRFCGKVFLSATWHNIKVHEYEHVLSQKCGTFEKPQLMRLCKFFRSTYLSTVDLQTHFVSDLSRLPDMTLPSAVYNVILKIFAPAPVADKIVSWVPHIINNCENMKPPSEFDSYAGFVDRMSNAYAHVWLSILQNFTLVDANGNVLCSSAKSDSNEDKLFAKSHTHTNLQFDTYPKGLLYFPYFTHDESNQLRFLSCGERGASSIPFKELINVLDTWTWIHILIVIVAIVISLRSIPEKLRESRSHWLSPLKVLLEQGDPFSDSFVQHDRAKWLTGSFLLVGIVLSNAYKNSNVYNMMQPKDLIPYRFFEELIKDNFTIYTRIGKLEVIPDAVTRPVVGDGSYYFRRWKNLYALGRSELSMTLEELKDMKTSASVLHEGLLRVSILHPSILILIHSVVESWNNKTPEETILTQWRFFEQKVAKMTAMVMSEELHILEKRLVDCNKVAVILPEYIGRRLAQLLKAKHKLTSVFLGKETLKDAHWLFWFSGFIPRYIVTRIMGTHESGIWLRWEQLFRESRADGDSIAVKAATMDGNVILIFLVWICGMFTAGVGFGFEIGHLFYSSGSV